MLLLYNLLSSHIPKITEWRCRINEGVAGMINAMWVPSSRSIITESDFGIQLAVWSLTDNTTHVIDAPKQPTVTPASSSSTTSSAAIYHGHDSFSKLYPSILGSSLCNFSDCRQFMALVHRIETHDYIGVYSAEPWGELSKFKTRSSDISMVQWTPSAAHIIAIGGYIPVHINLT